jgi:hypothetical protein
MLSGPVHVPRVANSVLLRCGVPLIAGATRLAGGNGEIGAAPGSLACCAVPSGFDAVTSTRTRAPSSSLASL